MQRDAYRKIIDWNNGSKRKPLILMGARQVGKTWLMDAFANEFYPNSCVKIDLQRDDLLRARIDDSNIDPKTIIDLIQASTGAACQGEQEVHIHRPQERSARPRIRIGPRMA